MNRSADRSWPLVLLLLCVPGAAAIAAETPFTPSADLAGSWEFVPDPALPNVLLIGDSISVGYTLEVRARLKGFANIFRPMTADGKTPVNCGDTRLSLAHIDDWLRGQKWSAIHFNWGIHDSTYRNPAVKSPGHQDKVHGTISVPPAEYEVNLNRLLTRMHATGAVLIWASTTLIPENEFGHFPGDEVRYNAIAAGVMAAHKVPTDDLYTLTQSFGGRYSVGPGNVHFTREGYALIADQVAAAIRKALAGVRLQRTNQRTP